MNSSARKIVLLDQILRDPPALPASIRPAFEALRQAWTGDNTLRRLAIASRMKAGHEMRQAVMQQHGEPVEEIPDLVFLARAEVLLKRQARQPVSKAELIAARMLPAAAAPKTAEGQVELTASAGEEAGAS